MSAPLVTRAELLEAPQLKEVRVKDQTGRTITTFEGTPNMWMRDFAAPSRRVSSIRTRNNSRGVPIGGSGFAGLVNLTEAKRRRDHA
jgi:hypothetical protein